ncbi:MAG: DUF4178 domain-containing protein [Atopobiaceae bacterium]|nr:DUF4178 domain-containing protein [Atopobiaceae bacterium]
MHFDVGNDLSIQGVRYLILGSILYEDRAQGDEWEEYRLLNHEKRTESWLSYDTGNEEYEMSFAVSTPTPPEGFTLVDSGTQVVRGCGGDVDVDQGETAQYETWEDAEGEHTYSVERWSDETEYSRGMYVQPTDIMDLGPSPDARRSKKGAGVFGVVCALCLGLFALIFAGIGSIDGKYTDVNKLLSADSLNYTLVEDSDAASSPTPESGSNDVTVYTTQMSVDDASKDIINKLEGNVTSAKEDDDKRTVAILTNNEYVLVYEDAGEDGMAIDDTEDPDASKDSDDAAASQASAPADDAAAETKPALGRTLVQVSSRQYAYSTDRRPYHSRYHSYLWYRLFYRARAFSEDNKKYMNSESSYSNYNGETSVDSSSSSYETYADSIRQQSAAAKSSSGGGTSHGK